MDESRRPVVSIVMGSDSDFPKLEGCIRILKEFGVKSEARVISAHRSPELAHEFAAAAEERGVGVIIAAAGGAAHLAGVIASLTTLPVIGVPISSSAMQGVDALHSTVMMPPGVPVATVGIDASLNAAVLAVQILALADPDLRSALKAYKAKLAAGVQAKSQKIQKQLES